MSAKPDDQASRRIAIIGAGALGSFLAARFAAVGLDVSLVARSARLGELRDRGLRIDYHGRLQSLALPVTDCVTDLPALDIVVLATKTYDLEAAASQLAACPAPPKTVLTVQNGVEAPGIVAHMVPGADVLAGRVHGFFELEGNLVRHVGVEPQLAFGPAAGASGPGADQLASCLDRAGIAYEQHQDMGPILWRKFLLASATGGVGAALGVPVGQLKCKPERWAMLAGAMREVAALAEARGVDLPAACVEDTLQFVSRFPRDATTSMQRDILAGRRSEFDHLTGAVIRLAEECDVPVPLHRKIARLVAARALEREGSQGDAD